MANRDVGVSICGVVVGVMLGAGSVLYAQDATLSANSSDVAYRGQDIEGAELYKARNVERLKLEDVRNDAGQNAHRLERKTGEDTTHESAPAVDVSTCGVATAIVARLSNVVTSIIPAQQEFEKFLNPSNARGNSANVPDCLNNVSAPCLSFCPDHCGSLRDSAKGFA